MKLCNSQHAYAKVRVIQIAFTSSSIVLQPIHVNKTRVTAELTVQLYLLQSFSAIYSGIRYSKYALTHTQQVKISHLF